MCNIDKSNFYFIFKFFLHVKAVLKMSSETKLLEANLHFPANPRVEEDFVKILLPKRQIVLVHKLKVIPDISPDNTSDCYF